MKPTETVDCDLCGCARKTPVFARVDEGLESTVVRCDGCGLLYTTPRLLEEALVPLYREAYAEGPEKSARRAGRLRRLVVGSEALRLIWHRLAGQCLSDFLRKARGKVLDVGCGTGDLLEEAAARGCECYGVEFNPDSARLAAAKGLNIHHGGLDDAGYPDAFFDTVVFWHSLEHLPSPRGALDKVRALLKPGGRVFVYLPNAASYLAAWIGPDWYGWQLPFHFYHFTPETLTRLAATTGFRVAALKTVTAEFILPHSLNRRLRSRAFGSPFFRAASIPVIRLLDAIMPSRGEFLFAELEAS